MTRGRGLICHYNSYEVRGRCITDTCLSAVVMIPLSQSGEVSRSISVATSKAATQIKIGGGI